MWNSCCGKLLQAALAGLMVLGSTLASAQQYPTRPIKIIMPYAPGGEMDRIARMFADKFRDRWGQAAIVENRAGAGGNIGAEALFAAPPDGYTLMLGATAQVVTNKLLYSKINYDPDAFAPISLVSSSATVLVAHPSLPASNIPQLLAYAKANPGKVSYATGGIGTSTHLSTELFAAAAGIKLLHIPYKSSSTAVPDMISGQVNIGFFAQSLVLPHVRAGRLKFLAVGGQKRNPIVPEVPTLSETLPGTVALTWYAMVAPPGTPTAITNQISTAIREILAQPDVAKQLTDMNIDIIASTPAEMTSFVNAERTRWTKVIRENGIRAE